SGSCAARSDVLCLVVFLLAAAPRAALWLLFLFFFCQLRGAQGCPALRAGFVC
ncbi:hypothetical protein A2U01_0073906, partial [Trifolium medium]|nr:hypothetical protein [Trifolium medium]